MGALFYIGTFAAVATTSSFIPQVIKIKKQGGEDLSYPMLFFYLCGTVLWLAYGILLHAAAVVWANAITAILVALAIALKMTYPPEEPSPESHSMAVGEIDHAAVWVSDLERARAFYERWFKATAGARYSSSKRDFTSYFLSLGYRARLELMRSPGEVPRLAHLAISVGSRGAVDRLLKAMEAAGVHIVNGPRVTGDGYYEALVTDTEGNLLEITS
jgi:lactoylglutathione lyase